MSNFLIGCITFVLLVLICNIINVFKVRNIEKTKQCTIEALKEIKFREIKRGKEVDLNVFEKILEQENKDE